MEHARIEKAVFDLFNIERAFIPTPKDKPRKATDCEVRAYAEWLALQAGLYPGFSSSIETVGSWSRQCDNRRTMGVTFGDVLKGRHYCQETRAYIPDQYADGAFSIPLPGRNSHRDTVTMETLGDGGEAIASQTLPIEPKKGGILWDRAAVRKACGPVAKPGKARKVSATPLGGIEPVAPLSGECETISASQTPQEAQEPVSAPQVAPETEIAPCDDLAGDVAALSVASNPDGVGFVVIDQAGAVMAGPFWTQWQAAAAMDDLAPPSGGIADAAPLSGELKAKRTPAHERAIRLAWAMRKAARKSDWHIRVGIDQLEQMRDDRDHQKARVSELLAEIAAVNQARRDEAALFAEDKASSGRIMASQDEEIAALATQLQAARADDESKAILRKSRDEARAMAITGREKRRKAVLFARGLQKRLSGEYRLNDRLKDQKRDAFKRLAQETNARLAAENAMAAIEARMNGWPPAVRSLSVNFRKAA